ncbi:hypothetical protein ACOSQ3_023983 [Xanthoceras sorbifolium]
MEMEQEIISETKPVCQLGPSSTDLFSLRDLVNCLFQNGSSPNQILAVANAVVAAANTLDSYANLLTGVGPEIMSRLKTLMLLLDPDKNRLVFSEEALKVVCDAWSVLSDLEKKIQNENETSFIENEQNMKKEEEQVSVCTENEQKKTNLDNALKNNEKERRESIENTKNDTKETYWTVCPYCYFMYEYEKWCEECCLRCQNCRRAFHGVAVEEPKNDILVEGRDEYSCGLGFFPLKYSRDESNARGGVDAVIEISDSDDDDDNDEAMNVNNDGGKVDAGVDKAKEEVVSAKATNGEGGCLSVMQGSGKTEERNGEKKRVHFKSVGRKSKVTGRRVKSRRIESTNEHGVKGNGHEMGIGSANRS